MDRATAIGTWRYWFVGFTAFQTVDYSKEPRVIRAQRKAHRRIWVLILIILPILVICSVVLRPTAPTMPFEGNTPQAMGEVLKERETPELKANLRGENGTPSQLELIFKTPLKSASSTVYDQNDGLIGQVGKRGLYRFKVPENIQGFHIWDAIEEKQLIEVAF